MRWQGEGLHQVPWVTNIWFYVTSFVSVGTRLAFPTY